MLEPSIDLMFPKAVLVQDEVNLEYTSEYKNSVLSIMEKYGTVKLETLSVDSSHKTFDKLHTLQEMASLVEAIYKAAAVYLKEYGYNDSFIKETKIVNMWANTSTEGQSLEAHIHQSSLLSGAYYVESPEGSKLIFNDFTNTAPVPENITPMSCNYRWYNAVPGRLIIFRSDMPHNTNVQPAGDRMVISFNMRGPIW